MKVNANRSRTLNFKGRNSRFGNRWRFSIFQVLWVYPCDKNWDDTKQKRHLEHDIKASINLLESIHAKKKKEIENENGRKDTAYASIAQEVNGDEDNYPDVTSN